MRTVSTLFLSIVVAASGVGCKKKQDGGGTDDKAAAKAVDLPALTAEPAVGDITPADKPPFESVKLRRTATRGKQGWPEYEAYNLGTKPITFMAIYGYAYDKAGTQVARTKVPLSWNGTLEPGKQSMFNLSLGGMDDNVPATADTYEVCVSSMKVGGEDVNDNARCPETKPKGK